MSYRLLKTRQDGYTLWIEVHNPPVNFVTTDLLAELYQAIRAAERDTSVRVVVLTSGIPGRYLFHFSIPEIVKIGPDNKKLGVNLIFSGTLSSALMRWQMALNLRLLRTFPAYASAILGMSKAIRKRLPTGYLLMQMMATGYAIENCRKITIAAISGTCNGSATEMASCFDFRFMIGDGGYSISHTEALIGILPGGGGTQRVTRLLGRAKAIELMLGCEVWSPQEAKRLGLITDCFPQATFVEQVQAYADRMSRRSLIAFTQGRMAITQGIGVELSRGLALETAASVRCCADPNSREALIAYEAFLQREVEDKPADPATSEQAVAFLESDAITRFHMQSSSPPRV